MSVRLPVVPAVPQTAPVFQHIAIVGLGRFGASLGLAARQRWPAAIVIGVDDHERLEQAIRAHAVDVAAPDLSILSGADLIILTGSPERNASVIARLPEQVRGPAVVTGLHGEDDLPPTGKPPAPLVFVAGRPIAEPAEPDSEPSQTVNGLEWRLEPAGPSAAEAEARGRLADFLSALGAKVHAPR